MPVKFKYEITFAVMAEDFDDAEKIAQALLGRPVSEGDTIRMTRVVEELEPLTPLEKP